MNFGFTLFATFARPWSKGLGSPSRSAICFGYAEATAICHDGIFQTLKDIRCSSGMGDTKAKAKYTVQADIYTTSPNHDR